MLKALQLIGLKVRPHLIADKIMKTHELSLGLLSEGDILSLSDTVCLKDGYLIDNSINAKHYLTKEAKYLINNLSNSVNLDNLISSTELSKNQLIEILFFINNIGGLIIKRKIINRIKHIFYRTRLRLSGIKLINYSKRYKANIMGLLSSFALSFSIAVTVILLTLLLIYGANFSVYNYLINSSVFLLSIIISSLIHEYTHVYFARKTHKNPVILVNGIRIGVLMNSNNKIIKLKSSFFGPLAGFLASIFISLMLFVLSYSIELSLISLLASLIHLLSLTPFYGDGKFLWKLVRKEQLRYYDA